MLRKIFVSLLILSALTSEGTVNIADYLINPHFYTDAGFSSLLEKLEIPTLKDGNYTINNKNILSTSLVSLKNDTSRGFFLSKLIIKDIFNWSINANGLNAIKSGAFELDKFNGILNSVSILHGASALCSYKVSYYQLFLSKNREMVLISSDLSPPYKKTCPIL